MKKILFVIAYNGFRDEELFVSKGYLEKNGVAVEVVSTEKGTATGILGGTIRTDKTLNEVNAGDYDSIVFVGGPGTPSVRSSERAVELAKEFNKKGKLVAAICWAPTILAKAGILKGRNTTVWKGYDEEYGKNTDEVLKQYGAKYSGQDVTVDGNIITANGPSAAEKFAKGILSYLLNT